MIAGNWKAVEFNLKIELTITELISRQQQLCAHSGWLTDQSIVMMMVLIRLRSDNDNDVVDVVHTICKASHFSLRGSFFSNERITSLWHLNSRKFPLTSLYDHTHWRYLFHSLIAIALFPLFLFFPRSSADRILNRRNNSELANRFYWVNLMRLLVGLGTVQEFYSRGTEERCWCWLLQNVVKEQGRRGHSRKYTLRREREINSHSKNGSTG